MMPDPKDILETACAIFGVSLAELLGQRRFERITQARQAAAWALMLRGLSKTEIAELLHRDRSTITTSIQRATELVVSDPAFAARWRALQAALAAPAPEPPRGILPHRMSQPNAPALFLWQAANRRARARPIVA